jgi:aspartate carbamoyltransferase catalytic subunit
MELAHAWALFLVLTLGIEEQLTHYEKPVNWFTNKNA